MSNKKLIFEDDDKFVRNGDYRGFDFYANFGTEWVNFCITDDALGILFESKIKDLSNKCLLFEFCKNNHNVIQSIASDMFDLGKRKINNFYLITENIIKNIYFSSEG